MPTDTEKMAYGAETSVEHVNDDSTKEAIDAAVREALDNIEALGYDEESAHELRSMHASASYGASDLEHKLSDDSAAHAILAEGYHSVLFENDEGQITLDYPTIQEAMHDVVQALGKMDFSNEDARNDAHGRFAEALMRRELNAMDSTFENWSSTNGKASEIAQLTDRFEAIASRHRENLIALMGDISVAQQEAKALENRSINTQELEVFQAKETQLAEIMARVQTEWYACSVKLLMYIENQNQREEPQAFREALSEINYDLNKVMPERAVAAYAVEEVGLMNAMDYLRDNAHHDMSSALLDGRLTTEEAVEIALNIDEMPKAMAQVHYGGETGQLLVVNEGDEIAAIYSATDEATKSRILEAVSTGGTNTFPNPPDASQYQEIRNQATRMLEDAVNTGDVRAIMESIHQIQEMPAMAAMNASRNSAEPTR